MFTILQDSRVTQWTLVRSSLVSSDSLVMSYTKTLNNINTNKLKDSNLGKAPCYIYRHSLSSRKV